MFIITDITDIKSFHLKIFYFQIFFRFLCEVFFLKKIVIQKKKKKKKHEKLNPEYFIELAFMGLKLSSVSSIYVNICGRKLTTFQFVHQNKKKETKQKCHKKKNSEMRNKIETGALNTSKKNPLVMSV